MKAGKSLIELATELERQHNAKKDYIAPPSKLEMVAVDTGKVILNGVNGGMGLKPIAHQQLASTLEIPKVYYDRLLTEAPDLLATNVNRWLKATFNNKLIRTMDGEVRAILSDSYRPLDNLDLAIAVIPKLTSLEARVESSQVTDSRLYIKAVTERISGNVKVGDTIQAGIIVSNSEVGQGSLSVQALDFRLACLNGMIRGHAIRKAHLGRGARGADAIEDAREFFRNETREADDRAFFLKVGDTVASMFNQDLFNKRLDQYREAAEKPIEADVVKVIELTSKRFGFNESERSNILTQLIKGDAGHTKWGLANAITRAAQDVESYDRSTEMERLGAEVIELKDNEWRVIAGSAA